MWKYSTDCSRTIPCSTVCSQTQASIKHGKLILEVVGNVGRVRVRVCVRARTYTRRPPETDRRWIENISRGFFLPMKNNIEQMYVSTFYFIGGNRWRYYAITATITTRDKNCAIYNTYKYARSCSRSVRRSLRNSGVYLQDRKNSCVML